MKLSKEEATTATNKLLDLLGQCDRRGLKTVQMRDAFHGTLSLEQIRDLLRASGKVVETRSNFDGTLTWRLTQHDLTARGLLAERSRWPPPS
jgi:hypothetical protein